MIELKNRDIRNMILERYMEECRLNNLPTELGPHIQILIGALAEHLDQIYTQLNQLSQTNISAIGVPIEIDPNMDPNSIVMKTGTQVVQVKNIGESDED